jgi:hypothetical protein
VSFVGPLGTWAGYELAAGSTGENGADDGSDSGIKVGTPTPTAAFTWSPANPTTGQQVTFDSSSSTCPQGSCVYRWEDDTADGPGGLQIPLSGPTSDPAKSDCQSASCPILNFTFAATGTKYVRLIVEDGLSQTDTVEQDVLVGAPPITAPSFIAEAEASWTSTAANRYLSLSVETGDVLVAYGMAENSGNPLTISGGPTWTLREQSTTNQYGEAYVWTGSVASAGTANIRCTRTSGSERWGCGVLQFRGSSGIGASSKTTCATCAPSLGLTTTQSNSAIVVVNNDWNAGSGASRAWRTGAGPFTETTYMQSSGDYTVYGGFHADAASAGAFTLGLSAPNGQKATTVAVEVKGS